MRIPEKILIIQLRRIGDVLLTTPAARALRAAFPEAKIDFLAEPPCGQALEGNPDISEVLEYAPGSPLKWIRAIRARGYDWIVDFLGNPRSALITALSGAPVKAGPAHVFWNFAYSISMKQAASPVYAAEEKMLMLGQLGVAPAKEAFPIMKVRGADEDWARQVLDRSFQKGSLRIAFAPASRKFTRRWPEGNYAELARMAAGGLKAEIMVLWGPGEKDAAERIAAASGPRVFPAPATPSLGRLAALLGRMDLLVTNCNGPKHIAVSQGCPTLTIHGSSDPAAWTPAGSPLHRFIRREDMPCVGCRKNECSLDAECLSGLAPSSVFRTMTQMLADIPRGVAK